MPKVIAKKATTKVAKQATKQVSKKVSARKSVVKAKSSVKNAHKHTHVDSKAVEIADDRKLDKNDAALNIPPVQRQAIDYVLITRKEIKDRCTAMAK